MSGFHDVRLPETVERGARGGPSFKTQVITLSSGFEERNGLWSRAKQSWDLGYAIQERAAFQNVLDFFYARRGKLFSFRFKDWLDFSATGESIGTGDGTQSEFQLQKTYSDAGGSYTRAIQKPVSGTITVFVDGVEDSSAAVDASTGVVTPSTIPTAGQAVTADFEFDVPVRFDIDDLQVQLEFFNAGAIPNIPVIEDLLPLSTLAGA